MTSSAAEEIAEFIDQKIHDLHYKVDHCRRFLSFILLVMYILEHVLLFCFMYLLRLIEGAESEMHGIRADSIVSDDRKQVMKQRLNNLRRIVAHLIEHMVISLTIAFYITACKICAYIFSGRGEN